MKKVLFLLVAALMVVATINAQEVGSGKFGLKAGASVTFVTNSDADARMSYYGGATYEYRLSSLIALSPELIFSAQGGESETSYTALGTTVVASTNLNLAYLHIPLLAKFYLGDKFSVDLGPQVGFLLSAKSKADGVSTKITDCNTFDLSIAFGMTYNFMDCFYANARYNLGVTNIADADILGENYKNGVFQLGVGFKF